MVGQIVWMHSLQMTLNILTKTVMAMEIICLETAQIVADAYGNSTIDRLGCVDTDGDGHSDLNDDFPTDPTRYLDTDGDGYDDDEDDCVNTAGSSTNGSIGCLTLTRYMGR